MLTLMKDDNGREFRVRVGEEASIELYENPTTGFSWVVGVTDGIEMKGSRFSPGSARIGSGGHHTWTIRMGIAGRQEFSGMYKRPREETTGMEKRFTVSFLVE